MKMKQSKYFEISYITDSKVVGEYEQIKNLSITVTREILDLYQNLQLNRRSLNQYIPSLKKFIMSEEAIVTDFLSNKLLGLNVGLTTTERITSILKEFILTGSKIYPMKIKTWKDYLFCYFIHIVEETKQIDFKESIFYENSFLGIDPGEEIFVKNIEEYHEKNFEIQKTKTGMKLAIKKIVLKNPIDLIRLPGNPRLFISNNLKNRLNIEKATGLKYKESNLTFYIRYNL